MLRICEGVCFQVTPCPHSRLAWTSLIPRPFQSGLYPIKNSEFMGIFQWANEKHLPAQTFPQVPITAPRTVGLQELASYKLGTLGPRKHKIWIQSWKLFRKANSAALHHETLMFLFGKTAINNTEKSLFCRKKWKCDSWNSKAFIV